MSTDTHAVEKTTTLALEERGKLIKSLRRFDMVFFTICAFVGLDTLGTVAIEGPAGLLLAGRCSRPCSSLPYMLLMSEVGSTFTEEGGPYEWVKLAFGRFHGGIAAVLYWVTNPLWVGGSLAFIATERVALERLRASGSGTFGDYLFKLLFIWISIGVAIASLRYGKWIPNAGAILRGVVLGFFSLTVIIYGVKHGFAGFAAGDAQPDARGLLRPRAAPALQLRRLRAAERGRGGDGEPAEGRAVVRAAQRRSLGVLHVRGPGARHHPRAPVEGR